MMNNSEIPSQWELKHTPRYTRQNMERAMQGKIERGLVELITNSDDSYRNIEETGKNVSGVIEIEIERRRSKPSIVIVRDFAEGMSREDMYKKLGALGGRTSGFEKGKPRRGLNGRGAKDVSAFGEVKFESIKDGHYNCLVIPKTLKCHFENENPEQATTEIREKLGILKGNGTVVTIKVEPRFKIPSHEKLRQDFSRYYSLRDIFSNKKRVVKLIDKKGGRENSLYYKYPEGECVFSSEVEIDSYPGAKAKIVLKKHPSPFEQLPLPYREGILIKGAAAIHDCTYFGLDSEPLAWRFTGEVNCPYIDTLINEYDDREEQNPEAQHPESNPLRLLDPFRDGLIMEHPFAQALYKKCREILKEQIEKLKLLEPPELKSVANEDLKRKLDKLSREISAVYEKKAKELDESLLPTEKGVYSVGIHIIPRGEYPIVVGESKTFQVVVKHTDIIDESLPVEITSSDPQSVKIRDPKVFLRKTTDDATLGKTSFTVEGLVLNSESYLEVRYDGYSDVVLVKVTEALPPPDLPYGLSFEKPRYRVKVNKEKMVTLWFKGDNNNPMEVRVESDCSAIVVKRRGKCHLHPAPEKGVYRGQCRIIGTQLKARGTLTARMGEYSAKTDVYVEEREREGFQFTFEPVDEDFGASRYKWDPDNPAKLKIGAKHPTVKRYLGEYKDGSYEGLDSPYYHIVLAEVIAEALAFNLLPKQFKQQSPNDGRVDADTAIHFFQKNFSEFLLITHKWLLPNPNYKNNGER